MKGPTKKKEDQIPQPAPSMTEHHVQTFSKRSVSNGFRRLEGFLFLEMEKKRPEGLSSPKVQETEEQKDPLVVRPSTKTCGNRKPFIARIHRGN